MDGRLKLDVSDRSFDVGAYLADMTQWLADRRKQQIENDRLYGDHTANNVILTQPQTNESDLPRFLPTVARTPRASCSKEFVMD